MQYSPSIIEANKRIISVFITMGLLLGNVFFPAASWVFGQSENPPTQPDSLNVQLKIVLTAPAADTAVCSGDSVVLTADVYDAQGTVSLLEFLDDTTVIGTLTTAPYTFVWTKLVPGPHNIMARVSDLDYGTATTSPITVMVVATPEPPVVTPDIFYCPHAPAVPLTATGTSLKWYSAAEGGLGSPDAPVPNTSSGNSLTSYYVTQTASGCESKRALIEVFVKPTAAFTLADVTICERDTATVFSQMPSGLIWYTDSAGGVGYSFPPPLLPHVLTSGIKEKTYYLSEIVNGCETDRSPWNLVLHPVPDALISPAGPITLAQSDSVVLYADTGPGFMYFWYKGTEMVGTDSVYTVTSAGQYSVKVSSGMCQTISDIVTVNLTTGIHASYAPDAVVRVYPNPSQGLLRVETQLPLEGATFRVLNALGSEPAVPVTFSTSFADIDVSRLEAGTYTLLILKDTFSFRKIITVCH